jgi:RimJ/RimL family protein N-acetyltransferase
MTKITDCRILLADDAQQFQALRLRGLLEFPTAFASSYDEECERTVDEVAESLSPSDSGVVFGSFHERVLVGVAGVQRESHTKLAHKAVLWGVYVSPEFRQQGVGRDVFSRVLNYGFNNLAVRQVNLGVNTKNQAAIALYESLGFEPFGVEKGCLLVDGQFHDELHMVCFRSESWQRETKK